MYIYIYIYIYTYISSEDLTQCVSWRSDGKLLLAGEASGTCAVIDAESKRERERER